MALQAQCMHRHLSCAQRVQQPDHAGAMHRAGWAPAHVIVVDQLRLRGMFVGQVKGQLDLPQMAQVRRESVVTQPAGVGAHSLVQHVPTGDAGAVVATDCADVLAQQTFTFTHRLAAEVMPVDPAWEPARALPQQGMTAQRQSALLRPGQQGVRSLEIKPVRRRPQRRPLEGVLRHHQAALASHQVPVAPAIQPGRLPPGAE